MKSEIFSAEKLMEEQANYFKNFYEEEEIEAVLGELEISEEQAVTSFKFTLSRGAANYLDMKSAYNRFYSSQTDIKRPVKKFQNALKKAQSSLEELLDDRYYFAFRDLFSEIQEIKSEKGLSYEEQKFFDVFFEKYEWMFSSHDDHDHDFPYEKTTCNDVSDIDLRGPYKKLTAFFSLLELGCKQYMERDAYSPPPKATALNSWVGSIGNIWEAYSPVTFTAGEYYEGIGYNSLALGVLEKLIAPLDESVTKQQLATAMIYYKQASRSSTSKS